MWYLIVLSPDLCTQTYLVSDQVDSEYLNNLLSGRGTELENTYWSLYDMGESLTVCKLEVFFDLNERQCKYCYQISTKYA